MMVVTRLWAFCLVFGLRLWFLLFSPPSGCFAHTASVLVEKNLRWQIAHTTNMAHISIPKNDGTSSVHGSLGTPTLDFNLRTTSRRFGTTWAAVKKPPTQVTKLGLSPRQEREAPRRQQGLPGTVSPLHRPRPMGGPMGGGSEAVDK